MQHGSHVPTSIIRRERVQFIYDNRAQVAEPGRTVYTHGDQHRLHRLGCGQKNVGSFFEGLLLAGLRHVAMPDFDPATD
ncbi:hypothetical protein D3C71_2117200 [compost metagenome]